ncbi:MAG TPA: fasciclin domain-containing protein [Acetobacteraceae bacterium]|nr:fasciclin domain-containing protein [Acetobacteraceae bacterium]
MRMTTFMLSAGLLGLAAPAVVPAAFAQTSGTAAMGSEQTVMVGGAPMYPSKNIVENAVNSKDHTTLVAAVKAAGLVQTLEGPGPFTVFAPTNEAFDKLPPGTVSNLLKPENKAMLTKILTYHVVSGRYTTQDLMKMVKQDEGQAMLKTVEGEPLTVTANNGHVYVEGAGSGVAEITVPNVMQSNGVIQVVNSVLLPK